MRKRTNFKQSIYKIKVKALSLFDKKTKISNNTVTVLKYDGIGDFVLFLDAARGLRKLYCDKTIIFSCPPCVKPMAERSDCFDKVIAFDKKEFRYKNLAKVKAMARALDCEILLHLSFSRDFTSEVLTSFIKANQKISVPYSYVFSERDAKWTHSLYDKFLQVPLNTMCLQQNKLVLQQLGYTEFSSSFPVLPAVDSHIYLSQNYYVMFLGGSVNMKKWPADNYYKIAEYIDKNTNYRCVLAGNEGDLTQEQPFRQGQIEYCSYVGKTSLEDLQALIGSASFVVGNDTSAIHMAASLGVPSLCVSSSASSNRFYPYIVDNTEGGCAPRFVKKHCDCEGCSFSPKTYLSCLEGNYSNATKKCIAQIEVDEVLRQVIALLKELEEKEKQQHE